MAKIREIFPQKINERILRQWQQTYLEKLLCLLQCFFFFTRTNGGKMETTSRKTHCPIFQNTPALHERAKTYSALSFDQIDFFNMVNLFSFSRKPFIVCCCFREAIKTFFFDACQMIVKSPVLHLFPVPQTGRSHIINILLASFFRYLLLAEFSVRTVNYGSSFFFQRLGHKSMEKKLGP